MLTNRGRKIQYYIIFGKSANKLFKKIEITLLENVQSVKNEIK